MDDDYILYVDDVTVSMVNFKTSKKIISATITTHNGEGSGKMSSKTISHSNGDEIYQLEESKGIYSITKYSLKSNSRSNLDIVITPSTIKSKFVNMFKSEMTGRLYLIELDMGEGNIRFLSATKKSIKNHGSLLFSIQSPLDMSCIFKMKGDLVECAIRESNHLKIVEISFGQDSVAILKETQYPHVQSKRLLLFNGLDDSTNIALSNEDGSTVFYSISQTSWVAIGKVDTMNLAEHFDTPEDTFFVGDNELVVIPKTATFSTRVTTRHTNLGIMMKRVSPRIESIQSVEIIPEIELVKIKLKGKDLSMHLLGASYASCNTVQHSTFDPICNGGDYCVTFNRCKKECSVSEEISLRVIPKTSRHSRSKFVDQFQSMSDVTSTMKLTSTNIPLTTVEPVLSIIHTSQETLLRAVSHFNSSNLNERRSMSSFENNIISDVMAFADFKLDETSMGNSFELWLISTDGKYYLQAQISQFGVGKPARVQIYPNLPGDLMTTARKSELETDRKICSEVKFNTMYRLLIQLTNPTFSEKTGLPLWTYRVAIVEPTSSEQEVCSHEYDSTMKKTDYEKIQDSTFAVGFSQSAYSKLFSTTVTSLNVSASLKAIGLRCQSEDCNEIYIVPSLNDIIVISATLGSSLLFVLVVICLMVSCIVCIVRPWHIELTEEQKKEMELKRNFERLQQLQRTMSSGQAHTPVRSIATKYNRAHSSTTISSSPPRR